jgi:hypothetical protein
MLYTMYIGCFRGNIMVVTFLEGRRVGRPKREDETVRANFKLNSGIRSVLKTLANQDGRSESAEVERLIIEVQALRNILKNNSDIASSLLPLLNDEVSKIFSSLE